jgi:restriction endonuclease S subunit
MNGFTAKYKLGEIARVRTGSPFRERIQHAAEGKYLVLQGKDIGADGAVVLDGMLRVTDAPNKGAPDQLEAGEVVIQTRGVSYRAAVVPKTAIPMIAAGSLFILSSEQTRLTPDYLVFFLNLPATQAVLRQLATGSTIPNLRRSAVEQLEIPLPTLPDQRRFAALGALVRKQTELTERINQLRLQELHALILERAKKAGDAPTPPASKPPERRGKRRQALS